MMKKEYLIYHELKSSILGDSTIINTFKTHEEALNYALKLNFDVVIYESVTNVSLSHEVEDIED